MVPCVAISLSLFSFLSFSLSVLAYSRSFSERWRPSLTRWSAQASLARGAELYDATVAVTWLFRGSGLARRASVWSNVCYDGRWQRVRTGERSRKQRRDGKDHPRAATLVSRDNSRLSLGRWVSGGEKLAWLICKTTVSLFLSPIGPATKRDSTPVFRLGCNNASAVLWVRGKAGSEKVPQTLAVVCHLFLARKKRWRITAV